MENRWTLIQHSTLNIQHFAFEGSQRYFGCTFLHHARNSVLRLDDMSRVRGM